MKPVGITVEIVVVGIGFYIVFYTNRDRIPLTHFHSDIEFFLAQTCTEIIVDKQI